MSEVTKSTPCCLIIIVPVHVRENWRVRVVQTYHAHNRRHILVGEGTYQQCHIGRKQLEFHALPALGCELNVRKALPEEVVEAVARQLHKVALLDTSEFLTSMYRAIPASHRPREKSEALQDISLWLEKWPALDRVISMPQETVGANA